MFYLKGPINESLGMLTVKSDQFLKEATLYDIYLEIRKDTPMTTSAIKIEIQKGKPPIMEIQCADKKLCLSGEGGKLFINPNIRLALTAECSEEGGSDCTKLTFTWIITKGSTRIIKIFTLTPL